MRRCVTPLATPIARACSYPYLRLFSAMFNTNKTIEQKVKASMATSLHRAFIERSVIIRPPEPHIYSQPHWRLYIVRIHNRIQSCAEWTGQHGTSSCLYNHDGFNAPTEKEKEKRFAFILRSTGAAVRALAPRECVWCASRSSRDLIQRNDSLFQINTILFKILSLI